MFARKDPNQLGLTVNGKASRLTIDDFDKLAIKMGLSIALIDEYVGQIESNFDTFLTTFANFGVPETFTADLIAYSETQFEALRRS